MSLLVFPLNFAASVMFPIKQTPMFNTLTQTPYSGRGELRIATMQFPRWDFVIDIGCLKGDAQGTNTPWQTLINFYMGVQGANADWLFLHPYDNIVGSYTVAGAGSAAFIRGEQVIQSTSGATAQVLAASGSVLTIGPYTGTPDNSHAWVGQSSGASFVASATPALSTSQAIAIGDGATLAFSIIRSLVVGGAQELMQNFVLPPFIFDNGALVNPVNYTIDQYGTLTFTVAPVAGHVISWTGQFYYRCHFLDDTWAELAEEFYQIWTMSGLKFRSVLL